MQAQEKETQVRIKTNMGDIVVKLYNDTPLHRDNFIKLINEGWYNNSPFHRVIKDFMIQGGGNADGRQDPGYTIPAEFNKKHIHKKGALAAARQGDQVNPQKASSGCQFYIVQGKPQTARDFTNYAMYYDKKFNKEKHYKEQYKEYCDYVSKSGYDDKSVLLTRRILELIYILEHLAGKKTEYLLMDEGVLTRTAFYTWGEALSEDELAFYSSFLNSHVYDKYDVHIANCFVDQELMLERIRKREIERMRKSGRVDRFHILEDDQLISLINAFEHNRKALIDRVHKKGIFDIQTDSYNISDVCDKILLATNS